MFEKVLVPLDGSELAEAVLPYVEELGKQCAAQAILLQVVAMPLGRAAGIYQPPEGVPMPPLPESPEGVTLAHHPIYREQEMESLRAEVQKSLAGLKKRLSEAGLEVRVEVLFGRPAEKIVEYAEEEKVDMIAMATHGRSGFSRWVFGGVAEKVLRATTIPILLIRPPGADLYRFPGVELKL